MKRLHVFLDPGHGGINPTTGQYVTPGKRSPEVFGDQVYEGVFNRQVASLIERLIEVHHPEWGIEYVAHAWQDTPLARRVDHANKITYQLREDGDFYPVYVSIHGNAGGGTGLEVFTSPGETASDTLATELCAAWAEQLPDARIRSDYSDGDPDKESLFYVLVGTNCPAILSENFFMDFKPDYELMKTGDVRLKLAKAHYNALVSFAKKLG